MLLLTKTARDTTQKRHISTAAARRAYMQPCAENNVFGICAAARHKRVQNFYHRKQTFIIQVHALI
jgi:hypothetical protein